MPVEDKGHDSMDLRDLLKFVDQWLREAMRAAKIYLILLDKKSRTR